jgi:CRP-like cAMP-binding protein
MKTSGKLPVDCETCRARADGLCQGCTPEVLRTIARFKSGDRKIAAGQDLFGLGERCDAIYNLVEGWIFLYALSEDGRRQILHFALPGAVLGSHPGGGALTTYGAQALTDAVMCVMPHANLVPMSKEFPEVGMRLAWLTSRDRSLAYHQLMSVGQQSARERVAHLILELYVRYRSQWPGARVEEMHLPLTQEHIGDATGLTSIHVNRVLRELREDGILEFHYRRLSVLDPDKLMDVAGVDRQVMQSWIRR